jgi:hypothetical protein
LKNILLCFLFIIFLIGCCDNSSYSPVEADLKQTNKTDAILVKSIRSSDNWIGKDINVDDKINDFIKDKNVIKIVKDQKRYIIYYTIKNKEK